MYRYLSNDGKIIVPLICSLFFVYFYFKYKKDVTIPKIGVYGNILIFLGCILLSCNEVIEQNYLDIKKYLTPFIGLDFSYFFLVLGAVMFLVAASKHKKYKNNIKFRYISAIYLFLFVVFYVFARIIYW